LIGFLLVHSFELIAALGGSATVSLGAGSFPIILKGVFCTLILFSGQNLSKRRGLLQVVYRLLGVLCIPVIINSFSLRFSSTAAAMTYSASLFVIPALAIAYLLLVYAVLTLAKRTTGAGTRRSEEIR